MKLETVQEGISLAAIVGNVFLIVMYSLTLKNMRKGTKFSLFTLLIGLLIFAAAAAVLLMVANFQVVRYADGSAPGENIFLWIAIDSLAYTLYFVPFNVAHWLLSFEYFSIAMTMPLVLKAVRLPDDKRLLLNVLKWSVLGLNVFAAIAAGLLLQLDNMVYFNHPGQHLNAGYAWGFVWAQCISYGLQITSGLFILYAVYSIRRYMARGLQPKHINAKNLALHAAAFIAYLLALILDAAFFIRYQEAGTFQTYQDFIEVQAVGMIFNFVGQLLLCKIFYEFGKPVAVIRPNTHDSQRSKGNYKSLPTDLSVNSDIENDSEAELKARIWNQFMIGSLDPRETVIDYYADVDAIAYNTGITRNLQAVDTESIFPKTVSLSSQSDNATVTPGLKSSPDPFESLIPEDA